MPGVAAIHYLGIVISPGKIPDTLAVRSPARGWEHARKETREKKADAIGA